MCAVDFLRTTGKFHDMQIEISRQKICEPRLTLSKTIGQKYRNEWSRKVTLNCPEMQNDLTHTARISIQWSYNMPPSGVLRRRCADRTSSCLIVTLIFFGMMRPFWQIVTLVFVDGCCGLAFALQSCDRLHTQVTSMQSFGRPGSSSRNAFSMCTMAQSFQVAPTCGPLTTSDPLHMNEMGTKG